MLALGGDGQVSGAILAPLKAGVSSPAGAMMARRRIATISLRLTTLSTGAASRKTTSGFGTKFTQPEKLTKPSSARIPRREDGILLLAIAVCAT